MLQNNRTEIGTGDFAVMIIFVLFTITMLIAIPRVAILTYKASQSLDLFDMVYLRIIISILLLISTIVAYEQVIYFLN